MRALTVAAPDPRLTKLAAGALLCVAALMVVRFWCAARAELLPEEAYYWTYWQHPALGYYDHPPMVAWIIGWGTSLFGNTEFGVRWGMLVLSLLSTGLLFLLTRLWFDTKAAWWTVLIFSLIPVYVGMGTLAFPDGPLVFFWLLTLWAVTKALLQNRSWYWLLAGLAYGGALLSKYTAVLLGPSLLLFFALAPSHRAWLKRPQPWLAVVLALAVFSPVIIWNAQHAWASFAFQATRTGTRHPHSLETALHFWPMQVGIYSPLLFGLLAVAALRAWQRRQNAAWAFATAFFWPLFLVFALASLKTEIHINWTLPAFLALLPTAGAVFQEAAERSRRWRIAGWVTLVINLVGLLIAVSVISIGRPKLLTASHWGSWRALAVAVEAAEAKLLAATQLEPFIIGVDKYFLAAELSFYTGEPAEQVNTFALGKQGLGFRYWTDLDRFAGQPAIAVLTSTNEQTLATLQSYFEHLDPPRRLSLPESRACYLVNCYGYQPVAR